jgi:hypothetical protein
LEWLGLVTPDRASQFAFKPTLRLVEIFSRHRRRGESAKESASIEDSDALHSIFDAALAHKEQADMCPLACKLLHVLGLVLYSGDGSEIPTRELRVLAAERREEERHRQLLKIADAGQRPGKRLRKAIRLPA